MDDASWGSDPEAPPVPWRWWEALPVFVLAWAVALFGAGLLAVLVGEQLALNLSFPLTVAVLGGVTIAWVAARHRPALGLLFGPARPHGAAVAQAVGWAVVALIANAALAALLTAVAERAGTTLPNTQEAFREAARSDDAIAYLFLAAVVFAPLGEELFFRGLLFQSLRRQLGLWPGIGTSALLFGIVHAQGSLEATGLVFAVIFPLGMLLAWVFARTGTIVAPMVVHSLFNLAGVAALRAGLG